MGMKLKLCIHVHDISLYIKCFLFFFLFVCFLFFVFLFFVCLFFVIAHVLSLLWQLKVSIDLLWEKGKLAFISVLLQIF